MAFVLLMLGAVLVVTGCVLVFSPSAGLIAIGGLLLVAGVDLTRGDDS